MQSTLRNKPSDKTLFCVSNSSEASPCPVALGKAEFETASVFPGIIGCSDALAVVLTQVEKVAPTDATVLITGESGTGKELIAQAIHSRSRRAKAPFICVNCAAIPPSLIADELFGHERGAFTGAVQKRLGRFELANGGTIFLDEIGDVSAETQIALLRVLQEHRIERVGSSRGTPVNVRVLAATHRKLTDAVANGAFRLDLFYRLCVFPIQVPPLRDRREDILPLAQHFMQRFSSGIGKTLKGIEKETARCLLSHRWPGNVRELQNVIERATILCEHDILSIEEESLFDAEEMPVSSRRLEFPASIMNHEKELIEAALRESKGRVAGPGGAAQILGLPRTTLSCKIKKLRIDILDFKRRLAPFSSSAPSQTCVSFPKRMSPVPSRFPASPDNDTA
jgi:formate hydrogenlyase transcriptional activator